MLNKLDLVILKDRRFHSKSIMMYKILNNLIDIPSCYFIPSHHSLRRGYFIQLPARIDSFKFSFFPSVIKIWNSLPSHSTNSPSLNHFCNYLDKCIATMKHTCETHLCIIICIDSCTVVNKIIIIIAQTHF